MATTIERPAPVGEHPELHDTDGRAKKQNRILKGAVAVLAIIAIGLGIALVGAAGGDDSDVPDEVQAALDEFERVTEEEDAEGLRVLATDDYFFSNDFYRAGEVAPEYSTAGSLDTATSAFARTQEFLIEHVGDPIVTGDGPWFVMVEENFANEFTVYEGIGRYTVVNDNGVIRVASHEWTGIATGIETVWEN